MTAPRIFFCACLLFLLQVIAVTLVTLVIGVDAASNNLKFSYAAIVIVSICVFAYMSWAVPTRPFVSALIVGGLSVLFGQIGTTLFAGRVLWDPAGLALDVLALVIAMIVGVSLGKKFGRNVIK